MDKKQIPLVSVWMITFNHEKYISTAIDSILEQKVEFQYEIIIGDDFSSDNTREILLEYKKNHPRIIKLLFHKANIGMIANQNHTFNLCRGKYIAMLEGDDYWCNPQKLQKQVNAMEKNLSCDICFHPVKTTDGRILTKYSRKLEIFPVTDSIKAGGYYCSTPSIMLRSHAIREMPLFLNDAPAGDYYIQVLASKRGGSLYIPDIMATYRINSEGSWSQTVSDIDNKINFLEKTLQKIIEIDRYLDYKYTNAFQYRYQRASVSLATTYLKYGKEKKFKQTIEYASEYVKNQKIRFLIVYNLRNHPKILISLTDLHKLYLKSKLICNLAFARIKNLAQTLS